MSSGFLIACELIRSGLGTRTLRDQRRNDVTGAVEGSLFTADAEGGQMQRPVNQ